MEEIVVMYAVNGSTKQDRIVASKASIQREHSSVSVTFPMGDGVYLMEFSKQVEPERRVSWVSYADCYKVERLKIDK